MLLLLNKRGANHNVHFFYKAIGSATKAPALQNKLNSYRMFRTKRKSDVKNQVFDSSISIMHSINNF